MGLMMNDKSKVATWPSDVRGSVLEGLKSTYNKYHTPSL